jgi:heptosyltransferase-3
MGPRAGIFCHNGLGDGIVSLVLSNNLQLNGWSVDTYQNTMVNMQSWFPHLPVLSYPGTEQVSQVLSNYDWLFVVHDDSSEFVQKLIQEGKRRIPEQLKVIYLYPSKNIVHEPYYMDAQIDPSLPVAENLRIFCERILHLPKITKSNGFIPPADLVYRKQSLRVAIHPTSSREGKNWPRHKYLKLAYHLKERGYSPVFIAGPEWGNCGIEQQTFPNLDLLARYLYESGYLIGNDSGLGHLASALGIPTLTLSRRKALANLWAPSMSFNVVVTPGSWIPNISGFRLRDRCWKKFISVNKARRGFERLSADF